MGSPNFVAYAALLLYVPVAVAVAWRTTATRATGWLLIGGVMFLPELTGWDFPLIPTIDKFTLSAIVAFVLLSIRAPQRLGFAKPLRGIDLLFVVLTIGSVLTSLTNGDTQIYGPTVLQGLTIKDAISQILRDFLLIYVPYLLGRAVIRSGADVFALLRILVTGGLVYSMFAWFEVRFSPQLHETIYGVSQMDWLMVLRMGGYRPMIFMGTGLAVGMFFLTTVLAANALARNELAARWRAIYLLVVLVACKSTGAIVYGLALLPIAWKPRKLEIRAAVVIAVLLLTFPLLRATGAFPTKPLVDAFARVSTDRAGSLEYRFLNEDILLDRAGDRVLFGWGGYGRSRVFDRETGEELSVTDGDWIIQLGARGLVGFLCLYGMITIPIFLASRRLERIPDRRARDLASGLALIAAVNALDLLPNGLFSYLPYFFSGSLLGLIQAKTSGRPVPSRRPAPPKPTPEDEGERGDEQQA